MAVPLIDVETKVRVSSVLNRDVKQFGKQFMFDGLEDTCWNSDQGTPQWIQLNFSKPVTPCEIWLQFQGGFSGKECWVEGNLDELPFKKLDDLYPEDTNALQVFHLQQPIKTAILSVHQSLHEMEFERGIWAAAMNGECGRVEMFLKKGINPSVQDSSGYTALHYSSRNGHKDICELLLQHGANVNAQTPGGGTPLHRAAFKGHKDIVRLLLSHGADPNIRDSDGKTALHKAAEGEHSTVAELFLKAHCALKDCQDLRGRTPAACVISNDERLLQILK